MFHLKVNQGLSWWLSGKESPANAGDMGSILGFQKIPHTKEQQRLCAVTTEPELWSLGATTTEPPHQNY